MNSLSSGTMIPAGEKEEMSVTPSPISVRLLQESLTKQETAKSSLKVL